MMPARSEEIARRLEAIRARVRLAALASGRDPSTVTLIAVSKSWPEEDVRAAYHAGQRDFGESYAQELAAKREALADLPDVRWHFIGTLQSNKAKLVVPAATLIHAVDRASVAEAIARRAQAEHTVADVLVEVNVGAETSKGGVASHDAAALLDVFHSLKGLRVRGLMCIPPPGTPAEARPFFRSLHALREQLRERHPGLELLSMGMSGDFETAVAEGATHVRVGTAIFGKRTAPR